MADAERSHAAEIARLGESVRHLESKVEDGAQAVRDGLATITENMTAMREDLREDMREIRDGLAEDVKGIARNVADLHNRLQNPDSGIIKIVDDHERRIKGIEAMLKTARMELVRVGRWALIGVLGFIGLALVKFAPQIGQWIADVKAPPGVEGDAK